MIQPSIKVTMDEPARTILRNLGNIKSIPSYIAESLNEQLNIAWSVSIGALQSAFPKTGGYESGALYKAIGPTKPVISGKTIRAGLGDAKALREVWYWQVLEGSPFGNTYRGGVIEPRKSSRLAVPLSRLTRYGSPIKRGPSKLERSAGAMFFGKVTHPGIKPARFMKSAYNYLKNNLPKAIEDSTVQFIKSPTSVAGFVLSTGKAFAGVNVKQASKILGARGGKASARARANKLLGTKGNKTSAKLKFGKRK